MQLRNYQQELDYKIENAEGNVLAVSPTGSGKTVVFTHRMKKHRGHSIAIAHRQELVSNMSLSLAKNEVPHKIIAPDNVIKLCIRKQRYKLGKDFYDPTAKRAVAGVDTLTARYDSLQPTLKKYTLWVMDEAHHLLRNNKWGRAITLFPDAKGLGVTATPIRADRKGLGRLTDGIFDSLVVGKNTRWLIQNGYLSPYKAYSPPPQNYDIASVPIGSTGDYVQRKLDTAVKKSSIVGDVVFHYMMHAYGKLGITFAPSVETATLIKNNFISAGIPAEVIHAKTPDEERFKIIQRYENKEILQLVNVDIFGEGFDLDKIECVSFARSTASWPLFVQQLGRGLRIMDGKKYAIILDHVGNILYHANNIGLPDWDIPFSLERGEKKESGENKIRIKICPNPTCNQPYERYHTSCPYCGFRPIATVRSAPEFVDGDLTELDTSALQVLQEKKSNFDLSESEYRAQLIRNHCPQIAIQRNIKIHKKDQEFQRVFRDVLSYYAGVQADAGLNKSEFQRKFYLDFGIDVLTAQTLKEKEGINILKEISK